MVFQVCPFKVHDQADQSCVIMSWDLCGRQPPEGWGGGLILLSFLILTSLCCLLRSVSSCPEACPQLCPFPLECVLRGVASPLFAGYYRYYNKYVNVKKGSIAGLSMVLAAYVFFNYCRSYKELSESLLGCFASGGVSPDRAGLVHLLI